MPRKPVPWYWEARKGWYVQIDRKQRRLGADPDPRPRKDPRPPADVLREFYRLMSLAGKTTAEERQKALVPEVCGMFLDIKSQMRDGSVRLYRRQLKILESANATREFRSLDKSDLVRVCEAKTQWGPGTRRRFITLCAVLFRWARDVGYLEFNPLAGWENPYQAPQRERGLTDEEFVAIMDAGKDIQWKQAMQFMRGTGCRPGEVGVVQAKHVHPEQPIVTLPPELHKTGRRTNRPRILIMPKAVEVMLRALMLQYPTGPLLRNAHTKAGWSTEAICLRFIRYRRALGLPEDCTAHLIRHATLTRLLESGTDLHLAAKIAGHSGTITLQGTYYHPDMGKMALAVDKASDQGKRS